MGICGIGEEFLGWESVRLGRALWMGICGIGEELLVWESGGLGGRAPWMGICGIGQGSLDVARAGGSLNQSFLLMEQFGPKTQLMLPGEAASTPRVLLLLIMLSYSVG